MVSSRLRNHIVAQFYHQGTNLPFKKSPPKLGFVESILDSLNKEFIFALNRQVHCQSFDKYRTKILISHFIDIAIRVLLASHTPKRAVSLKMHVTPNGFL